MLLIVVSINDPSFSPIHSVKGVVISLLTSIQSIVSVSGRISPQFWDVFHKPTTSLLFSLLVFQQLRSILLLKMLFKLISGKRCFLLRYFDFILTFVPEALWCCSLRPIILFCQDHVLLLAYRFNRSVVSSLQVLFILSSLASLFNRSAVRICSSSECFQLCSSSLFLFLSICSTSQGSWFHSFVQEAT